jgi:hypothetical protein
MSQETKKYKITGGTQEFYKVCILLGIQGYDIDLGKGVFYLSLTGIECQMLKNNGFEVVKR